MGRKILNLDFGEDGVLMLAEESAKRHLSPQDYILELIRKREKESEAA